MSPSAKSGTEKKEQTVHRLNRACRPCAKPSSISSFNHDLSDARTAEDKSPKRNGMNKSAKVVLGHPLQDQAIEARGECRGVLGEFAVEDLRLVQQQQRKILRCPPSRVCPGDRGPQWMTQVDLQDRLGLRLPLSLRPPAHPFSA